MDLKDTYNRIAEDWFRDHASDDWWIDGTDKFLSLLEPHSTVLDVGCGAGVKSKYISDKGYLVTGIDFSERFIEIACREVPGATFRLMDMNEVESLDSRFDGIFAQASLLHVPKNRIVTTITKLVSVLNKNGLLYIAVKGIKDGGNEEEIVKENDYGYDYERFFSYYHMKELEEYLQDLGLQVIYKNSSHVGKTDWLQIIGRKVV